VEHRAGASRSSFGGRRPHRNQRMIYFARFELREWGGVVRRRRLLGHLKSADLDECMIANALTEIRWVTRSPHLGSHPRINQFGTRLIGVADMAVPLCRSDLEATPLHQKRAEAQFQSPPQPRRIG
jgi:hypothetical protein